MQKKTPDRISRSLEAVKGVLERAELNPVLLEDGSGFEAHFAKDGPEVLARALVLEAEKFVFFFEFVQHSAEKALRDTMEFVTRANHGLTVGNFEMDYDSGIVRYKSSLDFSGMDLTALLVRNIILSAIYCVETYADSLMDVMNGSKSPLDAIDEAESSSE